MFQVGAETGSTHDLERTRSTEKQWGQFDTRGKRPRTVLSVLA